MPNKIHTMTVHDRLFGQDLHIVFIRIAYDITGDLAAGAFFVDGAAIPITATVTGALKTDPKTVMAPGRDLEEQPISACGIICLNRQLQLRKKLFRRKLGFKRKIGIRTPLFHLYTPP